MSDSVAFHSFLSMILTFFKTGPPPLFLTKLLYTEMHESQLQLQI